MEGVILKVRSTAEAEKIEKICTKDNVKTPFNFIFIYKFSFFCFGCRSIMQRPAELEFSSKRRHSPLLNVGIYFLKFIPFHTIKTIFSHESNEKTEKKSIFCPISGCGKSVRNSQKKEREGGERRLTLKIVLNKKIPTNRKVCGV